MLHSSKLEYIFREDVLIDVSKERKQIGSLTLSVCKPIICVFAQVEDVQLPTEDLHVL